MTVWLVLIAYFAFALGTLCLGQTTVAGGRKVVSRTAAIVGIALLATPVIAYLLAQSALFLAFEFGMDTRGGQTLSLLVGWIALVGIPALAILSRPKKPSVRNDVETLSFQRLHVENGNSDVDFCEQEEYDES